MPDFATSIESEAPIEIVFEHLVEEDRMTRWMGQHATLHAVPGGEFSVDINGYLVRGEYIEVERPHRVVVSWGMAGLADLPPGSSRVEFVLTPAPRGTTVNLRHTHLPESRSKGHAAAAANSGDPAAAAAPRC